MLFAAPAVGQDLHPSTLTLDAVEPKIEILQLVGPAVLVNEDKAEINLEAFGAVRTGADDLRDGALLKDGARVFEGVLINRSDVPALLQDATGQIIQLDPGAVGQVDELMAEGCSVDCGSGYYACCNDNTWTEDSCSCEETGSSSSCDSGGVGSTGCAVGLSEALRWDPSTAVELQ